MIGQRRLDVKAIGCDAYVTSPHKWLLAPKGTGVLYIRRDVQPRLWVTLASGRLDDDATGAFRFMQYGTGSVPVVDGLMAALQFIQAIGIERIERWDLMLANRLRDGLAQIKQARLLSPADSRLSSAIATFAVSGVTGRALQDALWEQKIRVRAQGQTVDRPVRLSAHLYVSPADIDRVLEVVAGLEGVSRGYICRRPAVPPISPIIRVAWGSGSFLSPISESANRGPSSQTCAGFFMPKAAARHALRRPAFRRRTSRSGRERGGSYGGAWSEGGPPRYMKRAGDRSSPLHRPRSGASYWRWNCRRRAPTPIRAPPKRASVIPPSGTALAVGPYSP